MTWDCENLLFFFLGLLKKQHWSESLIQEMHCDTDVILTKIIILSLFGLSSMILSSYQVCWKISMDEIVLIYFYFLHSWNVFNF